MPGDGSGSDGSESEEGHEKDQQEDAEEFLDATFSRSGVWNVVIGFALTNIILHAAGFIFIDHASVRIGWLLIWIAIFLGSLAGGAAWPRIEEQYAPYLPWMDSDQ